MITLNLLVIILFGFLMFYAGYMEGNTTNAIEEEEKKMDEELI